MSRIRERFQSLAARGETALIPFLTVGDPDIETSEALVLSMVQAGADLIELGVPFSDPIAEGPTIQRSSERALGSGTSLRAVLELVSRLRGRVDVPLILMGYANPIFTMQYDRFSKLASEVGVDGIIVPDLPPEEGEELYGQCNARGVDSILLAAPTTTPDRLAMLASRSRGFLYYVSLTGVTGARQELAQGVEEGVAAVRRAADIPVCVGFGISTPEQAKAVAGFADGVVVGSAVVDRIEAAGTRDAAVEAVASFVAELKAPLR
ncbi:MAG: tryptophan synthase subunit alpha [bacterium]|nr:tryptophan synthase subunit alpha [bacterium]